MNLYWVDGFCKSLDASSKYFPSEYINVFKSWLDEFLKVMPSVCREKEKAYITLNPIYSSNLTNWINIYISHLHKRYIYDKKIPFIWSSGYWASIIIMADICDRMKIKSGNTKIPKNIFQEWMKYMINNIPCLKCLNHGKIYLLKYPPNKVKSLLSWVWEYHNSINDLSSKERIDYKIFITKYTHF